MKYVFQKFYRDFYLKTGGFFPTQPLNRIIYPGDFFQIIRGQMMVLGNIFREEVVKPPDHHIDYGFKLNPINWELSQGVSIPYSGSGSGTNSISGEFRYRKQVIAFSDKGSYFFRGQEPEAVRISNWQDLSQALIIKLTQTKYCFRQLYVVTDVATTSHWTLAVSGSNQGELEIATDVENHGLFDIFGHASSRNIQSREIAYYHQEPNRKPAFFKAKKLVIQQEQLDAFTSRLLSQSQYLGEWATIFFDYDFFHDDPTSPSVNYRQPYTNPLDMLPAHDINPQNALLHFRWEDACMDDIEQLFCSDGG